MKFADDAHMLVSENTTEDLEVDIDDYYDPHPERMHIEEWTDWCEVFLACEKNELTFPSSQVLKRPDEHVFVADHLHQRRQHQFAHPGQSQLHGLLGICVPLFKQVSKRVSLMSSVTLARVLRTLRPFVRPTSRPSSRSRPKRLRSPSYESCTPGTWISA